MSKRDLIDRTKREIRHLMKQMDDAESDQGRLKIQKQVDEKRAYLKTLEGQDG